MALLATLAFAIPLVASVIQLLVGKRVGGPGASARLGEKEVAGSPPRGVRLTGDWFVILAIFVTWLISAFIGWTVLAVFGQPGWREGISWVWAAPGGHAWRLGFLVDNLSAATLFTVATCSLLIHVFSTGYMHGDPRYSRFFAYISFFTAAMIGLVLSDNLLTFFLCWELMGLCSYLLIGFWYEKPEACRAAIKAFLTTRVGDVLFFLGIAVVYAHTGDLTFDGLYRAVEEGVLAGPALALASAAFLAGCVGKSAQFPLHVWLPDAMEGPTPVSALIHAATMVAAGIYLVARTIPVYPPEVEAAAALLGAFTAVFAASMALVHFDFKKVLAYSTISQLGYMLMGLGVGGYAAGLFHLTTHAFFKALLFLASGAVLHAVHSRDMREMGGLRRKMPITFGATVVGTLALCGVPPLSGFYSKDAILGAAAAWGLEHGGWRWAPFALGLAGAGMTAFYMTRAVALVFLGAPRDRHRHDHAHEAPAQMWVPLVVLAVLAACAGWAQPGYERLIVMPGGHASHSELAHRAHAIAMWSSLAAAALGIGGALAMYRAGRDTRDLLPGPVSTTLERLYWVDEIHHACLVRPCVALSRGLGWFDRTVVDFFVDVWGYLTRFVSAATGWVDREGLDQVVVDGVGRAAREAGGVVRRLQTGRIQDYGLGLAGGVAAACAAIFLLGR